MAGYRLTSSFTGHCHCLIHFVFVYLPFDTTGAQSQRCDYVLICFCWMWRMNRDFNPPFVRLLAVNLNLDDHQTERRGARHPQMSLLSEIGKDISPLVFPDTFSKNQCTFISIISNRLVTSLLYPLGLCRFVEQTFLERKNSLS